MSKSNPIKTTAKDPSDVQFQRKFWGVIAISVMAFLAYSYVLWNLLKLAPTPASYVKMAVYVIAILISIVNVVLAIRRQVDLALTILFYYLLLILISGPATTQGRTLSSTFTMLTIGLVMTGWLLPRSSLRRNAALLFGAFTLAWVIDWINPPWRIVATAAVVGPIVAGIFTVILIVLLARESWGGNIRTKFLASIVGISVIAVASFGAFAFFRNQQSQNFWSNELQTTVQQQSQRQIFDSVRFEAHSADRALSTITDAVRQLASFRANLFASQPYFGEGGYWDGNSQLTLLPGRQYGNAVSDPASIFIPNFVKILPSLVKDLNTSVYLDFSAPEVLKENPNVVALYYISSDNYTVYYPNIDLANNVPPDFNAIEQPFYTIAVPGSNPERAPKWTEPYQDPAGTGLIVTNAIPIYDGNDRFRGVLAADIQLSKISEQISTVKLGESGFAFLIDSSGHIIAMPDAGYQLFGVEPEIVPVNETPKTTLLGLGSTDFQNITQKMALGEDGIETAIIQDAQYYVSYAPLPAIGYSIGLIAPTAELDKQYLAAQETAQSEERVSLNLFIIVLFVVIVASVGIGIFLSQAVSSPLVQLTNVAAEISKGNFDTKAEIVSTDEVGALAAAFNSMTERLRNLIGSLEQRVAERTRNLELAAEVGRSVSQVRVLDVMLTDAAELIRERFGLYYVQVYLANPSKNYLDLQAGTGNVGVELLKRKHRLPFDETSINGRAALEQKSVVIANTTESPAFKPNPLLPDTRSEMAVPLLVGDSVVGVLDMQSAQPGALTLEVLPAFEALAGQLAIAIQNANFLAETEQARAELEEQARRLVRKNYADYMESIHETEEIGYLIERGQIAPLPKEQTEAQNALVTPIAITGEDIGDLVVELEGQSPIARTNEFLEAISRQVAQQVESLRLLDNAERYRAEAEKQATQTQSALAQVEEQALQTQSALARVEAQARLTQRLSEAGLLFTRALNLQDVVKTAVETLEISEINRAVLEIFNYNSEDDVTGVDVVANWWNGTGREPTTVGSRYATKDLPLLELFLTPVPVFIEDALHDARIDNASLQTVERLKIHGVAVLPLSIADRQIGVLLLEAERPYKFSQDEISLFSAMAPQISTVLENRRQFERARQQADREGMLNLISQKIQNATTVEAVLQIAAREIGHALDLPMTVAQLSMKDKE